MKNKLFSKGDEVIRVLNITDDNKLLVIDCKKLTLPYFISKESLGKYHEISEDELLEITGRKIVKYEDMSQAQRNLVNKIFGSFSIILTNLESVTERTRLIKVCAAASKVNFHTIIRRMCLYLAYQDLGIFLPNNLKIKRPLSEDEKNYRWALNKYFYQPIKLSFAETYRRMIKERYMNEDGTLKEHIPTIRQFEWYYRKNLNKENYLISRNGKGDFMRNERALLGNGVREFCPTIGYGMFDSTILDIYLVNDLGEVVGRPVMVACVDGYSSYCMGFWLGFEGGVTSLKGLINNVLTDKIKFCYDKNIPINIRNWNCNGLPRYFITDRGTEYVSETFSQLTELGVQMINLPPYRPELKSRVEKFFDIIQSYFKKDLASKGVIFPDFQERGGVDYRKKACLTLKEFEKIMTYCVLKYNNGRVIDLPFDKVGKVKPFASDLWNFCLDENPNLIIKVDSEIVDLTLLPRCIGKFKRDGLIVNKLRYRNYDFIEEYLKGGECTVTYNPNDVSAVWLFKDSEYIKFDLIDDYFLNKSVEEVEQEINSKKQVEREADKESLISSINLSKQIEDIVSKVIPKKVDLKNIRKHRKDELKDN